MTDSPPDLPPALPAAPPPAAPVGCAGYVLAGASFIPLVGIPFGIVAIVWGAVRRAWAMVVLGVAGILFSAILYGSLYYFGFVQRGGIYDKLRGNMAATMLNNAVKDIEFYKGQHGRYPAALSELDTKDRTQPSWVRDPIAMQRQGAQDAYFFYELTPDGSGYFLRSVGADGVPFTADDILPTLSDDERKNTGLKMKR